MPRFKRTFRSASVVAGIVTLAAVLVNAWSSREDGSMFEVRFVEIKPMNVGVVTEGSSNNLTPLDFTVFMVTNKSRRNVVIQSVQSHVREEGGWRKGYRFQLRGLRTVPPYSSVPLIVQAVDDHEIWKTELYLLEQVPFVERYAQRIGDALRMKSISNITKPWWRTVILTNVYKREGTNLITSALSETWNEPQPANTNR